MKTGNGVPTATDRQETGHIRDDSQLRDIEELIAKLEVISKQLAFPTRPTPTPTSQAPHDLNPSPSREADEPRQQS
jgi:hypothetical protein